MIKKLDLEFELEGADGIQYVVQRVIDKLNEVVDKVNRLSGEQADTGWTHDTTNGED